MKTTASKAWALLLTGVPGWGSYVTATDAGGVTAAEWWLLAALLSEVALVYTVPNLPRPAPWQPEIRRESSGN